MKKRFLAIILIIVLAISGAVSADTYDYKETISTVESLMEIIKSDYYKDVDETTLIRGAIDGMFKTLDPHSTYMDAEEFKELMNFASGEYGSIGVLIEKRDGNITVVAPIADTPAEEAGLDTGDIIVSVDGTNIKDYTLGKAASLIKGDPGTRVKLGIIKAGTSDVVYIELTRALIKVESVKRETPFDRKSEDEIKDSRIGYIRLTEFSENTYDDFKDAIEEFKAQGKKGLIIDLRNNPGGLLSSVVEICEEIIPEGPIVHIDAKGEENDETYSSTLKNPPFKIAVIVNGGSASAAEILTGAVKDSKVGVVVGTKTYGKGTVQNVMYLTNGGGIKMTIAEYLTRNRINIDGKGIEPDVKVELPDSEDLAPVKMDRDITLGTVGLDVYGIQQRLKNMGYQMSTDGVMNQATLNAINKFLKDNKLPEVKVLTKDAQKKILEIYSKDITKYIKDTQLEAAVTELQKLLKN
ncbi:S41 family peptidase [Lutispora thermophila]|uniref:Carboxyl-terminal processing protease n=1 Tax=Lutispora thermophila DSM 19022 TaxID=1122184 RepID=A0A1M6BWB0_9FIRM|nr:S41 family peptidase [Lutispora thermophila]SHI52913.1 carboxyl-terminal processing protease [Lutispora thermophila DSM 19022]